MAQPPGRCIDVLVADHHGARRAALATLVAEQRDMRVVASVGTARETLVHAREARPAVVVVDAELPDRDSLTLAAELKGMVPAPAVLILSAHGDVALAGPAVLAGADGIVNPGVRGDRIVQAIKAVNRGELDLPPSVDAVTVKTAQALRRAPRQPHPSGLGRPRSLALAARRPRAGRLEVREGSLR